MLRRRAILAVLAVAVLVACVVPTAGAAAPPPARFFGVLADGPMLDGRVDAAAEMRLMKASGAGSVRLPVYWRDIEPQQGVRRFEALDAFLVAAADAGLEVLPVVLGTPAWASRNPSDVASPPADPATYAAFVGLLARRYKPAGTFWTTHVGQAAPIRRWQIWNEPDLPKFWAPSALGWASDYVRLLRAARQAIKAQDPGATIVLAGLTNRSWIDLRSVYRAGGRGAFDVAAAHPFSGTVPKVLRIVRYVRAEMRRAGDARKPLLLSEIAWSSGKGRSTLNYGWETSEAGQAQRVRALLTALAARRVPDRLAGLDWATWISPPIGSPYSFDYTGLRRFTADGAVSKPALAAFSSTVTRLTRAH
ncbi:unannotated protein [freshwater metagenome]|uniref:Unannotated protein n=1 Tax=freshwater metagenome TaxID=449393 RepID=A0A6J7IGN1_9ZZZZ